MDLSALGLAPPFPTPAADDAGSFSSTRSASRHDTACTLEVGLGDMDFGIFGDGNASEKDTVPLIVLNKREHGTSYCGSCIGGKK